MSKIWQALKEAELRREPTVSAVAPSSGESLSVTQRRAVQALLVHRSVGAAAEACGVSQVTLEGWLKSTEFVAAYHIASRVARFRR